MRKVSPDLSLLYYCYPREFRSVLFGLWFILYYKSISFKDNMCISWTFIWLNSIIKSSLILLLSSRADFFEFCKISMLNHPFTKTIIFKFCNKSKAIFGNWNWIHFHLSLKVEMQMILLLMIISASNGKYYLINTNDNNNKISQGMPSKRKKFLQKKKGRGVRSGQG